MEESELLILNTVATNLNAVRMEVAELRENVRKLSDKIFLLKDKIEHPIDPEAEDAKDKLRKFEAVLNGAELYND